MICAPLPDELTSRIDPRGDCWEWIGGDNGVGYGRVYLNGTKQYAHRAVWEALVGPIGDGLTIDHLCRNHSCVNPDHLEPVTQAVNNRRGSRRNGQTGKTHCPYGHAYEGVNVQTAGRRKHWRRCAQCHARRNREYRERKRNAL